MANKIKETVDYFPFFVKDGKTLFVLKKKYGLAGIGFFTELFRILAQTPKHCYAYNDEYEKLRLIKHIGIPEEELERMLIDMAGTGKIDRELWHKYKVIASEDFINSLAEAYRRRSADKQNFKAVKKAICRQYDGNMSETCRIKKRKENKIKQNKTKQNSDSEESQDASKEPKKLPLSEREPINDMERVEKAYLQNWNVLYSQNRVKEAKPVVNWNQSRKLLKTHFENIEPALIIKALEKGMKDDWVMKSGYSLGIMLTASVLNRLINTGSPGPLPGLADKKSLSGLASTF